MQRWRCGARMDLRWTGLRAYTGILIDDLISKGNKRALTGCLLLGRSFRLHLRIDNADSKV